MADTTMNIPSRWQIEFPDFAAMPSDVIAALASGQLVDISWRNDGCPSFVTVAGNAQIERECAIDNVPVLWIDYENAAQRSDPTACRYFVHAVSANDSCITDDIGAALAYLMAAGAK